MKKEDVNSLGLPLFGEYDTRDVVVHDPGLRDYISLDMHLVPRRAGRYASLRFYHSKYHILERLMNKLQVTGHLSKSTHKRTSKSFTGKGITLFNVVHHTLKYIEQTMTMNPIQVLVTAVENGAPREVITTIEYGGARYMQAVECAPQKRVDMALRHLASGAYMKSFKSKKPLYKALGDEIMQAYKIDQGSHAISRKLEFERQADSSR